MAADEVIKIETKEAAKSVSDLRKEIKTYNEELSKTKVGTEEYQKTLEKLGATKDDLNDLKDVIGALNPEGKVAAFSNVAGKLAGGFQAATGAAALFGVQSEEVEKQLLKVQAATAFAQGIQSVVGLGDAFAALKVVLLSFNPILLGITAAVAAIGLAYKVWSEYLSDAAKNDALLNSELERQSALQENINAGIQRQLELSKAVGGSAAELNKAELDAQMKIYSGIRTRQILLQQINDKTTDQTDELRKLEIEEADSYNKILVLKITGDKKIREENKKTSEEQINNSKDVYENEIALLKKRRAVNDAGQAAADANNKSYEDQQKSEDAQALKDAQDIVQKDKDFYKNENIERLNENKSLNDSLEKQTLERTSNEKKLEQEKAQASEQILSQSLDAAKALSDLYFQNQLNSVQKGSAAELEIKKKAFNVNKAFAIADTIINGVRAVQQALTNPYPLNLFLAAASGILAAANVAKIASTKFDSGSASASASTSISAPNVSAPSAPVIQPQTNINANGTVNNGAQVRTYVLAADVTDKQNDANRIRTQSRF